MDATAARDALTRARSETRELLRSLGAEIDGIVDARRDSNNDDEHDPEGTTLAYERSQADALRVGALARLDEIGGALDRLSAGDYGRCEVCGAAIAEGRLAARPWASRCITHA
ncbi:TraR/DksA C4-type zinc finger protein [Herbiconiux sp. L3-i23]|uniref:TraR/DksA family transcriptional regulator n=1 Tax=Herbiconiux sp. L3-i23 TaxID=2905871 RepID=UPI0020690A40|nr:TraR/DksA C4-type zinc finger protein [Herbiconiux sp. L3-i23]BDI23022.1 DnaK suppressor protein [Herbiconiux sp. L3-i23]